MSLTEPDAIQTGSDIFTVEKMRLSTSLSVMISDARRMLRFVGEAAPGALKHVTIAAIVGAIATTCLPYTTRGLIDAIPVAKATGIVTLPLAWLAAEVILAALQLIAGTLMHHGIRTIEVCAGQFILGKVLEKSCRIAYTSFETPQFLNRLSRARMDAPSYGTSYSIYTITVVRAALTCIGCMSLLLWAAPIWTVPLILIAAIPSFLFDIGRARRSFVMEGSNMHRSRQAWYIDWLLSTAEPIKEIRAYGIGRWLVQLHYRIHAPFRKGQVDLSRQYLKRYTIGAVLRSLVNYAPYCYFVINTIRGNATLGQLLFFLLAFNQCSTALSQMFTAFATAFEHHLYVHNIVELLDYPEADSYAEPQTSNILSTAPEFIIEDLWFSYPGSRQPVLRGLNLHIHAGETLAIVGRNGIGKTTLVKVLLGLYSSDRGKVTIGGVDIATQSIAWRRDNIGIVMQDFVRYHFGAGDGVGLGWLPDVNDTDLINKALRMAEAESIVSSLSHGLDTPLGPGFGGQDLSGGQWQRMALARLFMRRSRLWIMDEPTSAMDPETEERAFQSFRQWKDGRTAIIITHRFLTARVADRIAVIDDGRVVEIGTHDELVAANGYYAGIFNMQAQAFASGTRS